MVSSPDADATLPEPSQEVLMVKSLYLNPFRSIAFGTAGLVLALAAIGLMPSRLAAQESAPEAPATREERIRQHRERIRQIIEERRKQQEERGDTAAEGKDKPVAPARPGAPPGPGIAIQPAKPQEPADTGAPSASNVKINNYLLYLKPLDNIATVGERFSTRVVLENPTGTVADRVSIVIGYDPRIVSCVQVFDDQFRPYVVSPPDFEDRPADGMLIYQADLKHPRPLTKTTVLTLVWETHRTNPYSQLAFLFRDQGATTAITYNGRDVLGIPDDPYDGVINASLLVKKPEVPSVQTDLLSVNRKEVIDFFKGIDNPPGNVTLALGQPGDFVRVGQTFDVPVFFQNSEALVVDTVSLLVHFNPDELEVIDWDKGNWIRRGINIYDGDRHEDFPFDYLIRNEAYNATGVIDYRMGLQRPDALPSGRLATIRFRALQPSAGTTVKLVITPAGEKRTTSVSLHGEELLDLTAADSKAEIRFRIYP